MCWLLGHLQDPAEQAEVNRPLVSNILRLQEGEISVTSNHQLTAFVNTNSMHVDTYQASNTQGDRGHAPSLGSVLPSSQGDSFTCGVSGDLQRAAHC